MAYKLISKVIIIRLQPFFDSLVGLFQDNYFIISRGTKDNVILAQEVLHFIQKLKTIKDDLEKAYDRVKSWLENLSPSRGMHLGDHFRLICLCFVWRNWHSKYMHELIMNNTWKPLSIS
ncbi:hypothetical protein CR513_49875, partial [Mucuna pruriens]